MNSLNILLLFMAAASLSPMHFTPSTPGHATHAAFVDNTLQIYSIKIATIHESSGLSWPLRVYGVIAARDEVDRNRNILFYRKRDNCQILTQEVCIAIFLFPFSVSWPFDLISYMRVYIYKYACSTLAVKNTHIKAEAFSSFVCASLISKTECECRILFCA